MFGVFCYILYKQNVLQMSFKKYFDSYNIHTVVTHRLGRCFADIDAHFSHLN